MRTNNKYNAIRFRVTNKGPFRGGKGVKNKWSCSQVWVGYARLSGSFIVSRKRIVRSRFRVRGPHVSSALSIPDRYPCHTEILFLGIWFIVVLEDHPAEYSMLWNPRRREELEIDTATCAHARSPLGNGWCTVRGGLDPRSSRLGAFLHIGLSALIDLCTAEIPLEKQPLWSYITHRYVIWSDCKDFFREMLQHNQ